MLGAMLVRFLNPQRILFKTIPVCWVWLSILVIPSTNEGQERHKFKAGLGNTVRPNFKKSRYHQSIKWKVGLALYDFVFDGFICLFIAHFSYNIF